MLLAIRNVMTRIAADERGLTSVEYAVLGGIIVTALVAVGVQFQTELEGAFTALFNGI